MRSNPESSMITRSGSTQIGFIPSPWDISGLKATPFRLISTPISTLAPIRPSLEKLIGNSLTRTTFTWSSFRFGPLRLLHSVATSSGMETPFTGAVIQSYLHAFEVAPGYQYDIIRRKRGHLGLAVQID